MKSIRDAKAAYEAIRPPDELSAAVRDAVRSTRTGTGTHVARWSVMAAAAVCALFVVLVNASPVLANSLYGMPVIGNVARVYTVRKGRGRRYPEGQAAGAGKHGEFGA